MRNWIRLYFRQNYASFSSFGPVCHKIPATANILHRKFYHTTPQSLCINRLTSQITHPYQSGSEPNSVPISDLLSDLNSRLAEATFVPSGTEVESISNSGVLEILRQCSESLPQFTNDDLLKFMDSLQVTQGKYRRQFFRKNEAIKSIIDRLDQECLARSSKMDLENILPMMEKFSRLTNRYTSFLQQAIRRHCSRIHNKPADKMIRLVNVMNKYRYWENNHAKCKPYEIEHYLEQNFDKLNTDQMITLIQALTQANKSIVNFETKKKLFLYVVQNFLKMSDNHLHAFLNLFCVKESFTINMLSFTPEFLHLLDTCDEKFDSFALQNAALIGMLSTKFLVHKPHFLDKLCRRFLAEGERCNKTTIDNIVFTLMFFNYRSKDDEDVYSKILQIITRDSLNVSYKHTRRYFRLISWFCNVGVYDYNIIDEILDEKYLQKTYSSVRRFCVYPYPLVIDLSVQIECPGYAGNRLSTKLREDLLLFHDCDLVMKKVNKNKSLDVCGTDQYQLTDDTQQYDCKQGQDLPYYDILKEMSSKLNTLFGKEITHVGYVLPHMPRPNLIFGLDESGQLKDLAYLKDSSIVDYESLDSKYDWFVVTVLVRNTFLPETADDVAPWGMEIVKWRQLQKLGIKVVAVVQDEWMTMSEEQKIKLCSSIVRAES